MKTLMKASVIMVMITSAVILGAVLQGPKTYFCTTDSKDPQLMCMCLSYHPDFCSEEGPIPSCCKAGEDHSKANGGCHCCKSGKPATVSERGTYTHFR